MIGTIFLKQSTAATILVGPFVDATDGFTPETGLAIGSVDSAVISKNGAAAVNIAGTSTFTAYTGGNGMYTLTLSSTDTNTLGNLFGYIRDDSVCRPVSFNAIVLPANVYDSLVGGTDYLLADVYQFNGNAASGLLSGTTKLNADAVALNGVAGAASNLSSGALAIVPLTCSSGSTTTSIKSNATEATNDHYNGRTIVFTSGTLSGQAATITDYDGTTKSFTVPALTEAPTNGDTFIIC